MGGLDKGFAGIFLPLLGGCGAGTESRKATLGKCSMLTKGKVLNLRKMRAVSEMTCEFHSQYMKPFTLPFSRFVFV